MADGNLPASRIRKTVQKHRRAAIHEKLQTLQRTLDAGGMVKVFQEDRQISAVLFDQIERGPQVSLMAPIDPHGGTAQTLEGRSPGSDLKRLIAECDRLVPAAESRSESPGKGFCSWTRGFQDLQLNVRLPLPLRDIANQARKGVREPAQGGVAAELGAPDAFPIDLKPPATGTAKGRQRHPAQASVVRAVHRKAAQPAELGPQIRSRCAVSAAFLLLLALWAS